MFSIQFVLSFAKLKEASLNSAFSGKRNHSTFALYFNSRRAQASPLQALDPRRVEQQNLLTNKSIEKIADDSNRLSSDHDGLKLRLLG